MARIEEREQARLVRWTHSPRVRALIPALAWLFHCPNGGLRSALAGAQMKALGVKKGVPDLLLPVGKRLAIEMKAGKGATSPEQVEWLAALEGDGWHCHVCRSAEEARFVILRHFGISPHAAPELAP